MKTSLETVVAWAKRKGFVYPNSEIYGGLANAWDFGPYGALLKKNIADLWVKHFTQEREDMVFMDTAIIAHPTTWQASGHLASFADALIDDKKTGQRFRADKLIEDYLEKKLKKLHESWKIEDRNTLCLSYFKVCKEEKFPIKERKMDLLIEVLERLNIDTGSIQELQELEKSISENEDPFDFFSKFVFQNAKVYDKKTWIELLQKFLDFVFSSFQEYTNEELELLQELRLPNLSPESRGNEGMRAFIVKHLPNNPETWNPADWTECRNFNLMLSSHLGPIANESSKVYMRPETCQSLFTDFKAVLDTTRMRIPFGLAQVWKAFRNEITPGQFLYRTREFEQMEIEYFVPADAEKAMEIYNQWKADCMHYWTEVIGISPEHLRFKDHEKLAHYAAAAVDIEYLYPRGFGEIQGIHNRTNFDLSQHQEYSKKDMQYSDPYTGERYIPRCVEASFGLGRQVMVTMLEFYDEETLEDGSSRVVIRFPKQLAPVKFAILPLVKKDQKQVETAEKIFRDLSKSFKCEYDDGGAIGKRYRRQDEIWTPYCITIDPETVDETSPNFGTVTVRERDSMQQRRVKIEELSQCF